MHRSSRGRAAARAAVVAVGLALVLGGCSAEELSRGFLPEASVGATDKTPVIQELWNGSWIAALAVGAVVWGLTLWNVVAYRRRRSDEGLPAQVRYHLPIEILYTVVPFFIIAVLFYFTARDQAFIEEVDPEPDYTVNVVGKQWGWDFNYVDDDVYDAGIQAQLSGQDGVEETLPTLYLPQGERIEFVLTTRDVNHSFWVPAFLYKKDLIAGRINTFQVVPEKLGTFQGKCAELCGEYHAEMLFNVEVVTPEEFDEQMDRLRDLGQTGQLPSDLGRSDINEDDLTDAEVNEQGGEND